MRCFVKSLFTTLCASLLIFPIGVFGAIAFDAASLSPTPTVLASSITWSHTCTGTNPILIVDDIGNTDTGTLSVTYNGAGLTLASSTIDQINLNELWYKIGPTCDGAAHDVVVTWSVAQSLPLACAMTLTGVAQTNFLGSSGKASGSGADSTSQITTITATANSWIVNGEHQNGSRTITPTAGTDQRQTGNNGAGTLTVTCNSHTTTAAGSYTTGSTISGVANAGWNSLGIEILANVAAPATTKANLRIILYQ